MDIKPANSNKPAPTGQLPANIMHFARVLRDAGLPVGPGAVLDALDAVQGGGMATKKDFYWILHSVFVKRREHTVLFDHAFEVFWRKPKMVEQLMQLLFQQVRVETKPDKKKAGQKRLAEAMFDQHEAQSQRERPRDDIELEGEYTSSAREVLRSKDFEQMSAEEERQAREAIQRMRMNRLLIRMRRFKASPRGVVDLRATLRKSMRSGGNMAELKFKARQTREPPLVVLLDISGSMANYSRVFLHFLHALTNDRSRVQVFTFGTRLTNITRELKRRDVDEAMELVGSHVNDWSGGTRIGHILREFNVKWSRRVLAQGAHVLLMTDGLDRDDVEVLEAEMARLHRSARRVVWLNPLLRYAGFEARAAGIKAMMPHVDEFRPCHSLNTLADLAEVLSGSRELAHDGGGWRANDASLLAKANDWVSEGREVALATVIETWGSAPQPVGSQLVIDGDGNFEGSVSGGCVEGAVVTEALDAIATGKPKVLSFGVADETAWEVGLACGGKIRVYVEPVTGTA